VAIGRLRRPALLRLGTVLVSTLLGLVMAEGLVRLSGFRPVASVVPRAHPNEPTLNVPDPILGWRPRPGFHRFRGYTPDAPRIAMTILSDGSRAASRLPFPRDRRVVFVGDSFTAGWAVSDTETYVWKLQARYPAMEFRNYGAAGYSGLQALLRVEEDLASRPTPPELVVYGFNDDQERRNVATAAWLWMISLDSSNGTVEVPFASLDESGRLVRHPPATRTTWPLRDRFAIVPLLEQSWLAWSTRHRAEEARRVTELVIEAMDRAVRDRGGRFLVAILAGPENVRTHYLEYLARHGIEAVDCSYGRGPIVRGEGHPSGEGHSLRQ